MTNTGVPLVASSIRLTGRKLGRSPALIVPVAAEDPLARLRLRAYPDAARELRLRARVLQVDVVELTAAVHEVHVGVVEARDEPAALGIDDGRIRAAPALDSSAPPTSTMRSPMIATATASGCRVLPVQMFARVMTRSAARRAGREHASVTADAIARVAITCPGGVIRIGDADYNVSALRVPGERR